MNYTQLTNQIEKFISEGLVLIFLGKEQASLLELYAAARAHFGSITITAGMFNKVIDDMTRIGLIVVDRKSKMVVSAAVNKLVTPMKMAELKALIAQDMAQEASEPNSGKAAV